MPQATGKNDIQWHEFSLDGINIALDPMFPFMYNGMNIEQSLFEGGVSGTVMLRDADPKYAYDDREIVTLSQYLRTGGKLKLAFSTPDIEDSFTELQFYITSIQLVANQMPGMYLQMGESTNKLYQVDFASYEDVQVDPLDREFGDDEWVGPIDRYVKEELGPNYFDGTPYESQEDKKRQTTAKEPMDVDITRNWVWLRPRYFMYPWGKVVKELNVDRLINNLAENSIDAAYNAPNYLFWQDFNRWHFKSITSLIRERYVEQNGYWRYDLSSDEGNIFRFDSIKSVKGYDIDNLVNSGAFASQYKLVEPNYNSIYDGIGNADLKENVLINHLSTDPSAIFSDPSQPAWTDDYRAQIKAGTQFHDTDPIGWRLRERNINFDYRKDFLGLAVGEPDDEVEPPTDEEQEFSEDYALYKRNTVLIGTKEVADLEDNSIFNPETNKIYDDIYGWFNFSQYNNPNPTLNDQYSYVEGKNQEILWQAMFDITPLDGNMLYSLRTIRTRLKKKRLAYSLLSTLKQHWNYYRYSMCCSEIPSETESFAALVAVETAGKFVNEDGESPQGGGPVPFSKSTAEGAGGEEGPEDGSYNTADSLYWPIYRYAFYPVEIVPKWDPTLNYNDTSQPSEEPEEGETPDPTGKDFLGRPCNAYHEDGSAKRVHERYDQNTLAPLGPAEPNDENNFYRLNHDHLEWFNINPNKNANFYAIPKGIQFEAVYDEDTGELEKTLPYHTSFNLPTQSSDYGTVSTDPDNQTFDGNRCKIKEGVVDGYFLRGNNIAWNMNELSNYWTWVNPGINMYGADYPDHPESFSVMPVGAVFGQDPVPDEITDTNRIISPPQETYANDDNESELLGRIVKLTPILKSEYQLPLPFSNQPIDCSAESDDDDDNNNDNEIDTSIFPESIKDESGVDEENGIFMIVNKIFGTQNLPKPFGGKKEDLSVIVKEEDEDDPDIVTTRIKNYDQDCTYPISTADSTGSVETPIYIFDVENAHDGNCEGTINYGPYMSTEQHPDASGIDEEEPDP